MVSTVGIIMTNEEFNQALELADAERDNKLSFEEFICFFLKGIFCSALKI